MRLLSLIASMFLISLLMDRALIEHQSAQLFEELAETNAYLLVIYGGLAGLLPKLLRGRLVTG
jgi:hypothetical protein